MWTPLVPDLSFEKTLLSSLVGLWLTVIASSNQPLLCSPLCSLSYIMPLGQAVSKLTSGTALISLHEASLCPMGGVASEGNKPHILYFLLPSLASLCLDSGCMDSSRTEVFCLWFLFVLQEPWKQDLVTFLMLGVGMGLRHENFGILHLPATCDWLKILMDT